MNTEIVTKYYNNMCGDTPGKYNCVHKSQLWKSGLLLLTVETLLLYFYFFIFSFRTENQSPVGEITLQGKITSLDLTLGK